MPAAPLSSRAATGIASRTAVLLTLISVLVFTPAATATTVVSGAADPDAPLVIDPTAAPTGPNFGQTGADIFFIQNLPASRTITRVTIGDLARHPDCANGTNVQAGLVIREYPTGSYADPDPVEQELAGSVNRVTLTGETTTATFKFAPTRLTAGRGYLFRLAQGPGSCFGFGRTTWAHNRPTVNGGPVRCAGIHDGANLRRLWHVQGEDDALPNCVASSTEPHFDASMPTGWLVSYRYFHGWDAVFMARASGETNPNCDQQFPGRGLREVLWRGPNQFGQMEYACLWTHWAPPGDEPPDGWYYAPPDPGGISAAAPRDMYLKLEYNPADDPVEVPDCSALTYEACVDRIRLAGFTAWHRVDLVGMDIDYSRPPDAVSRTEPPGGTQANKATDVAIHANPARPEYERTILARHAPLLRYDNRENFYADSAGTITDNPDNALRRTDGGTIAVASPDWVMPLNLEFLGWPAYANNSPASDTDFLDEVDSDYVLDAQRMHEDPNYANRTYGHFVTDPSGTRWLQYWFFYYYNDKNVQGIGVHEGDWEMMQISLDPQGRPAYVVMAQHEHGERCPWGTVEKSSDSLRPTVYPALGSHASYFHAGAYPTGAPFVADYANGEGDLEEPRMDVIADGLPWVEWQGTWGASTGASIGPVDAGGKSPAGPKQHSQWDAPDSFFADAVECRALPPSGSPPLASPPKAEMSAGRFGSHAVIDYSVPQRLGTTRPDRILLTVDSPSDHRPPASYVYPITPSQRATITHPLPLDPGRQYRVLATVFTTEGYASEVEDVSL